jgi:hypothetical protein
MPRKRASSKPALKRAGEPTTHPTDDQPREPPSTAPEEPSRIAEPLPPPFKLRCQAATNLVKERTRSFKSAYRKYHKAGENLGRVTEREEKVIKVLDRPRPPMVRLPPEERLPKINLSEARLDRALHLLQDCSQAMWEAKEELFCAIIGSRNAQIARLRRLLRKHHVRESEG